MRGCRWLAIVLLALDGCASVHREVHRHAAPLRVEAVVVYPLKVVGESLPPSREYGLGERLTLAAIHSADDRLSVFGPEELRVLRWEDDAAWVGSDAVSHLVQSGIRPEAALVLRPSVEKRVTTQAQEARDARGRRRGGWSTEETTWVGRVELLHPSSRHLLAEVEAQVVVDPFAAPSGEEEFDPSPAMTHLLERLVGEAIEAIGPYLAPRPTPPPPPLSVTLALSPAAAAAIPDPSLAALDPLAMELWLQNQARFLTPRLSEADAPAVARSPRGLFVLDAPKNGALRRGDVVLEIDGAPPSLARLARQRLRSTPVPVKVRRGEAALDLDLR